MLFWTITVFFLATACGQDEAIEEVEEEVLSSEFSNSFVNINHEQNREEIYLKNTGNIPFDWSVDLNSRTPSILITPSEGVLEAQDSVLITVTIDRTNLVSKIYDFVYHFEINNVDVETLNIRFSSFTEEKWILSKKVIDAEYSKSLDAIITITSGSILSVVDPINRTMESLNLNALGICVSVSPNGNRAVVGHDGLLSLIDLLNLKVLDQFDVPFSVFDAVLTTDDNVYLSGGDITSTPVYSLNLATGESSQSNELISNNTIFKLHSSEEYMYSVSKHLAPSEVNKYSIVNGRAEVLYEIANPHDLSFGHNLWISPNDQFLIEENGGIFQLDETQTKDLIFLSELPLDRMYRDIKFSISTGNIYALQSTNTFNVIKGLEEVLVFNNSYELIETSNLPKSLLIDDGIELIVSSLGQFGFLNNSEDQWFVITRGQEVSSGSDDKIEQWAVAYLSID
ncbi:MAG: hypothetical protein ABJP45_00265 [Cyclobacteriaceae bacterium]